MSRDHQHASKPHTQNAQKIVCNHHNNSYSATSLFKITHVSRAAHVPFPQKCICTRPGENPSSHSVWQTQTNEGMRDASLAFAMTMHNHKLY